MQNISSLKQNKSTRIKAYTTYRNNSLEFKCFMEVIVYGTPTLPKVLLCFTELIIHFNPTGFSIDFSLDFSMGNN